eukprot:PhF_6_TR7178/c0_g1_i1/m.10733
MSIESTLGKLMKALKDNKRRTGEDEWEGKPKQDTDIFTAETTIPGSDGTLYEEGEGPSSAAAPGIASDPLEDQMRSWVQGLIQKHRTEGVEGTKDAPKTILHTSQQASGGPDDTSNKTLADLLDELDSLT